MLKVMRLLGEFGNDSMRTIPDHYILKRWTLEARRKEVGDADASGDTSHSQENETGKGDIAMRYRETTAMFNQLATKLLMADEKVYNRWMGALQKVCKEANKALSKTITSEDGNNVPTSGLSLKEKSNPRKHGKERYKSTNEKERRRKKIVYGKRLKALEVLTQENHFQHDDHLTDLEDDLAEFGCGY
ncbi:unnamed protein product [Linum trigynum]|uniref:Protein FAR1-RELATED SEQUENCE n=1 Tax=Linum trigynum TaxID=586398 RepID=A0AAV2E1D4_9ROSI